MSDERGPGALTVFFDEECRLCRRARAWLDRQAQLVPLTFVPLQSEHARELLPDISRDELLRDMTVLADDGALYRGAKGWIMCLWALRRHRARARKLASPVLWPLARSTVDWISRNRR